jgi:hypothetical protein
MDIRGCSTVNGGRQNAPTWPVLNTSQTPPAIPLFYDAVVFNIGQTNQPTEGQEADTNVARRPTVRKPTEVHGFWGRGLQKRGLPSVPLVK